VFSFKNSPMTTRRVTSVAGVSDSVGVEVGEDPRHLAESGGEVVDSDG
jgi:hypothetical protein